MTSPKENSSPVDWRPGLINALLLGLLLCGIFGLNYVVDPFAFNRRFDLGLEKRDVAYSLSNYAWKYPEYLHDPKPVVLLGDSRTRRFDASQFEEALGRPTYNMGFGGATLHDIIDSFWFVAERGKLERVYLGLGSLIFSDGIRVARGAQDLKLLDSPIRYYFSPFVTKASLRVMLWNHLGVAGPSDAPPMSREDFWAYQLSVPSRQFYGGYAYPKHLLERLTEVAEYCKRMQIELLFYIPPTHTEFQETRVTYGVEQDYRRSVQELAKLAPVVDWDYSQPVTLDENNFDDPVHAKTAVIAAFVEALLNASIAEPLDHMAPTPPPTRGPAERVGN